jgi:alpha-galactosidase
MDENSPLYKGRYITMDLYRRYDALLLIGDRHVPEFAPQYLQVDSPEELHRWGVRQTPHAYYLDSWNDTPERIEAMMAGELEYEITDSGEEFVPLIRALLGQSDLVTNINYPNVGQMPDIRSGAVVETNAHVSEDSVRPITAGSLPEPVIEQIRRHVSTQETVVKAAFDGDLDLAFRAFRNDPQLLAYQPDTCEEMFRELVTTSHDYLGDWDMETASILE